MLESVEAAEARDFGEFIAEREGLRPPIRMAPPRTDPMVAKIERTDDLRGLDEEAFDRSRPPSFEDAGGDAIDPDHMEWAAAAAWRFVRGGEGASFARVAEDTFLIPVTGGQVLHHDRHISDMDDGRGFSEHTWNLVVQGEGEQMLLCENGEGVFEHFPMRQGVLVYMNTVNRHALSRRDPSDVCIILQVCGYGPDQRDAALARMTAVAEARPMAMPV